MIVTVDEVKNDLRLDHSDDDSLIAQLIAAAQGAAEDYCRVKFDDNTAPAQVRQAVILLACFLYENPDMASTAADRATNNAFRRLLYPHRDEAQMF